jgi:phage-related tail protein
MTTSVADLSINVAANIANAVEGMARLGRSVDGAADRIVNLQSVAGNFARTFATTLAGAFSVGALTEMAVGVVRAAASLDDLSEKTGASVESLSRFAGVARITGQDVGSIESSMSKQGGVGV